MLRPTTRPVFTSLALLAAVSLSACESMQPSGDPLAAVPVMAAVEGTSSIPNGGADPRFQDDLFEAGSEDLQTTPKGEAGGGKAEVQVGAAVKPAAEPTPAPSQEAATQTPSAVASTAVAPGGTMAWPVRLVRTHLDEQPPSAVLALPDGRRIVVSPGDMVPERGLVVMAIGKERIQLAAISSRGDHATVVPMELSAQY